MVKSVSIARRLSLSISAIVILVVASGLSINYYLVVRSSEARLNERADLNIQRLSESLKIPLWQYDHEMVLGVTSSYLSDSLVGLLEVSNEDHEKYVSVGTPATEEHIIRSSSVLYNGRMVGYVRIGLTTRQMHIAATRLLWSSIIIIFLVGVSAMVVIRLVFHRFLETPLADLGDMANAYANNSIPSPEKKPEYLEFRGLVSTMEDMGDQIRQQMSALQISEERFRRMADFSPYPIYLIDNQLRIIYINQKFKEVFGYELEEIANLEDWWRLVYRDENSRIKASAESAELFLEAVTEQKQMRVAERTITCKNGNRKPVEIFMVNIGDMMLVHMIDLSRRKKMQELMVQTEKMISVGGLAAGMAHEINNPLSAIMQGAQNTIRRLSPDLKKNKTVAEKYGIDLETLNEYIEERGIFKQLEGIREAGDRAAQIILNVLKFTRRSDSNLAPVRLVPLLESAIELAVKEYDLAKNIDFNDIELIREYDPDLDIVTCTETEIGQVILNLLKNASQVIFESNMTKRPWIAIRTKLDGRMAQIEVEDNGPGMDNEVRKRIFEPFYTTKPVGQGTGLGLSVSYMIITNNHNGTMEVESEPGKGTRVIIRLPLELRHQS